MPAVSSKRHTLARRHHLRVFRSLLPCRPGPTPWFSTVTDPYHTDNVAVARGSELHKSRTKATTPWLLSVSAKPRSCTGPAKDGTKLEASSLPADYTAGKKYPFLVLPHGGPEANDRVSVRFILAAHLRHGICRAATGNTEAPPATAPNFLPPSTSILVIAPIAMWIARRTTPSRKAGPIPVGWPFRLERRRFIDFVDGNPNASLSRAIEGAGITDWLSFIPPAYLAGGLRRTIAGKRLHAMLQFSAVDARRSSDHALLILHGDADRTGARVSGPRILCLLAERGKTVRMVTYPGAPHFPRLAEQRRDVFKEITGLAQTLQPVSEGVAQKGMGDLTRGGGQPARNVVRHVGVEQLVELARHRPRGSGYRMAAISPTPSNCGWSMK